MKPNDFENLVKSSLEQYEESYDPAQWEKLSRRLDQSTTTGKSSGKGKYAAIIAAVIGISVLTIWLSQPDESGNLNTDKPVPATLTENSPVSNEITEQPDEIVSEAVLPESKQAEEVTAPAPEKTNKVKTTDAPISKELKLLVEITENEVEVPELDRPESKVPAPKPEAPAAFLPGLVIKAPSVVCEGEIVELSVNPEYAALANYTWTIDGTTLNGPAVSYTAKSPGTQVIKMTASNEGRSKVKTYELQVKESPSANIRYQQDPDNLTGLLVTLSANVESGSQVNWDFGDGQSGSGTEVKHIYKSSRFYNATAFISNTAGCKQTVPVQVEVVKTSPLGEQSTLTPNFDGQNETFMPPRLAELDLPFEMSIQDATGKEVFRTTDISRPWNGRINNSGEMMPVGFYKWHVVLELSNGQTGVVDGVVRLMK